MRLILVLMPRSSPSPRPRRSRGRARRHHGRRVRRRRRTTRDRSTAPSTPTARPRAATSSTARRRPTGSQSADGDAGAGDDPVPVSTAAAGPQRRARRTTTGSSRPTPTAPPTGADRTFRTRLRRRALPGITSHRSRARSGTTQRLAAQPRSTPTAARRATTSSTGSRPPTARARPSARSARATRACPSPSTIERPAAVPPLPLPRRGDQRGRAQRAAATARSRRSASRRPITLSLAGAAHALGRGDRGVRPRHGPRRAAAIPVALERQDFPFAGPFSSIGAPRAGPRRPRRALPLLRARRCSPPPACARSRARRSS